MINQLTDFQNFLFFSFVATVFAFILRFLLNIKVKSKKNNGIQTVDAEVVEILKESGGKVDYLVRFNLHGQECNQTIRMNQRFPIGSKMQMKVNVKYKASDPSH